MKASGLLLKVYGERENDQWTFVCLDFSLAAQGSTINEARQKLEEQIFEYIREATVGEDKEHAATLLRRRAPLKYYAKWYLGMTLLRLFGRKSSHEQAFRESVPMVPAHC
ncbi:hypothetical protein [Ralstonia pseudosolanacearum]|uniref:hypothetical protein n=1 Tax=Ralstonia pseudosolanacearum TaxID=1310165 RepID=UPI00386EE6A8